MKFVKTTEPCETQVASYYIAIPETLKIKDGLVSVSFIKISKRKKTFLLGVHQFQCRIEDEHSQEWEDIINDKSLRWITGTRRIIQLRSRVHFKAPSTIPFPEQIHLYELLLTVLETLPEEEGDGFIPLPPEVDGWCTLGRD